MIDSPTRDRPASASRRTSSAWAPFRLALERAIGELGEDRFLILGVKRSGRCIQFAGQGAYGLRAEVVGNAYLPDADRLGPAQLAWLEANGWRAPTGTPEEATPERDPDGSPNPYIDFPEPVDAAEVADLAVLTLVEALEVEHPGGLEYRAFDADSGPFELPGLGLRTAARDADATAPIDRAPTPEDRLLAALREATGIDTLDYDEDRDVGLRYGDQPVFVRLLDRPPRVRIHAVVLGGVEVGVELLEWLNALNAQSDGVRWFVNGGRVVGVMEIPAEPVVSGHVAQALHGFCAMCEDVGKGLRAALGGHPGVVTPAGTDGVLH